MEHYENGELITKEYMHLEDWYPGGYGVFLELCVYGMSLEDACDHIKIMTSLTRNPATSHLISEFGLPRVTKWAKRYAERMKVDYEYLAEMRDEELKRKGVRNITLNFTIETETITVNYYVDGQFRWELSDFYQTLEALEDDLGYIKVTESKLEDYLIEKGVITKYMNHNKTTEAFPEFFKQITESIHGKDG